MSPLQLVAALVVVLATALPAAAAPPPAADGNGARRADGSLRYGAHAGLNLATVVGSDADNALTKTTFGFGVVLDYSLGGNQSLQVEANYMQQGADGRDNRGDEFSIAMSYLQLPLLGRTTFPISGKVKPYLLGGVSLGVLLSASSTDADETIDIEEISSSLDFSIIAALGAELPAANYTLVGELRYMRGLIGVDDSGHDLSLYNRLFSLLVGARF